VRKGVSSIAGVAAHIQVLEEAAEQGELRCCRFRPIDERLLFQGLRMLGEPKFLRDRGDAFLPEDDRRIGMEGIEEEPAGRRIRAVSRRIGAEHRVVRT
jgi:hypothetical protein